MLSLYETIKMIKMAKLVTFVISVDTKMDFSKDVMSLYSYISSSYPNIEEVVSKRLPLPKNLTEKEAFTSLLIETFNKVGWVHPSINFEVVRPGSEWKIEVIEDYMKSYDWCFI